MPLKIDGIEYCKAFMDRIEYCVGYRKGVQVFGCRVYNPPTVDDNSAVLDDVVYIFKETDFTLNFTDPDGDGYSDVIIMSLPTIGKLKILGRDVVKGDTISAVNSPDLEFHLSDDYAIYNGVLYQFNKSIGDIILEHESANYKLIQNESGTLTFGKGGGTFDTKTIRGTAINNKGLCFNFITKDDSSKQQESNLANFCLIPQGNVNVKPVFNNEPPTVGDNEFTI